MVKTLVKYEDDYALVFDKSFIDSLDISGETKFEISVTGKSLILTPQDDIVQESIIRNSLKKINKKYSSILKKLGE
jgi:hypothetical protein